jgi:hypothetical protein
MLNSCENILFGIDCGVFAAEAQRYLNDLNDFFFFLLNYVLNTGLYYLRIVSSSESDATNLDHREDSESVRNVQHKVFVDRYLEEVKFMLGRTALCENQNSPTNESGLMMVVVLVVVVLVLVLVVVLVVVVVVVVMTHFEVCQC